MIAAIVLGTVSGVPATAAEPPPRVVIDLMPMPCPERSTGVEVTVCGRRTPDYRLDPGVLAGTRAREALPTDLRTAQGKAVEGSCHDQPSKCQGGGVIPVLAVASKTIEAVVLAVKGDDWREPFRTKPDEYEAYRAEQQRTRVSVSLGASAGTGAPPRP